ncbi:NAD(P)H-dependent oxidoreductase [Vibrio sp. Isolate23]|uniref:NADPH-dependent FMN reductase n=1 Tax=Vibrio sp. Isolate23 TaxID=2908533 RepID=UPI001EFDAB4D|nr:NAD(P)H-dependent oxidoreductase [Vibrio sp. Isolate23]MCG9681859.1 NAD(P)H-dependent oxidoreductase [Vibrio sp. Isolate23]
MKVLAFGASSSKHSINQKLAFYAAKQIEGADISLIDINDYEMPIFSEHREKELGSPQQAQQFFKAIGEADIVVISFAEHNGSYTAAYKNLFDWTSRINMKVFQNKPVILLATSPGAGGASSVLNTAQGSAPYFAADVKGALSLPNFYDNFDIEEGVVTNQAFNQQLLAIVQAL